PHDPPRSHYKVLLATLNSIFPLFVFLTLRRPAESTLFPYTTLFRSRGSSTRHGAPGNRPGPAGRRRRAAPGGRGRPRDRRPAGPDRKSTRLNSSHVASSYAVFCLKKKRNDDGGPLQRQAVY